MSVYGLNILPIKILAILVMLLAILVSLRALSPSRFIGYLIDLYFVFIVIVLVLMILRRRSSLDVFLKPDISILIVSSIYALIVSGYIPILVALFTVFIVLSSMYVENIIGHSIFLSPRSQDSLGQAGGAIGSHVKLYPGVITLGDAVVSRGSIVVREPYNSDSRSYREAGDLVIGYSSVESGSAEALVISGGSMFSEEYDEAMNIAKRVCTVFSVLVYVVPLLGLIVIPGIAVFLSIAAPSIPYIYTLYMARRSSDLAKIGVVTWRSARVSSEICNVKDLYLDAGSTIYTSSTGEISIKPRSSLAREELMRIICAVDNIDISRAICKGYEDYGRGYIIVKRSSDLAIVEDTRSRIRICISTPDKARINGFQWDISSIDPGNSCQGTLYVISTRYEILGYICVSRSISISSLMSLSRLSRDYRVSIILDSGDIEVLNRSSSEIKKILDNIDLKIQRTGDRCPEKHVLAIMKNIPVSPCGGTIYIVDPKQAAKKYKDLRTSLAKGAAITLKRDIEWVEKIPGLCRRWGEDLGLIITLYTVLRGGGAILSIMTGIIWASYILEVTSYAVSMLRMYSR